MPLLIITKPFKFAHQGITVEEFHPADEPQELTDDCAEVALANDWATLPADASKPADSDKPAAKAKKAPETAAAAAAPEVKA